VCLGIAFGVFGRDVLTWRLVLSLPFLIAAFFGISLARLDLRGSDLYYARLFKWKKIPDDEIIGGKVEWPPVIGSVRLKRFMFPWGRLYFVLDQNLKMNPLHRGDYALLSFLRGKTVRQEHCSSNLITAENQLYWLKPVITGLLGALISFILQISLPRPNPRSVLERPIAPSQPSWYSVPLNLMRLMNRPPVVVALFVIFIFLAVYKRRRPDAWIFAFLAGMAVPYFFP
jgi:hypothetical protein